MSFNKRSKQKPSVVPPDLQGKFNDVIDAIEEGIIDPSVAQAYKQKLNKAQVNYYKGKKDHVFKARLNLDMGIDAYLYVLENSASPDEALAYTQKIHDLTDEFIAEAKNNKYMNTNTAREVVKAHDNHPRQKRMKEEGKMDRSTLVDSKSPNQQLLRLHRQTLLDDTINYLSKTCEDSKLRIDILEEAMRLHGLSVDKISMCKYLNNKGYSVKTLAEHYKVSQKTIKRWIKL